jgi:predicted DNA-binding transcriptional regulator AlpA
MASHQSYSSDYAYRVTARGIPKIIRKRELAQRLGCSERQIYRMIVDGRLPAPMKTNLGYNGGWLENDIINHISNKS